MSLLPRSQIVRFRSGNQWVSARAYLARILWLQGLPDQAMRTAASSVAEARAANHAISLCHALTVAACPIALFMGDLAPAEHYVEMLLDDSTRHALARWRAFCHSYQGVLAIQRGDLSSGLRLLLRAGFADPAAAGSTPRLGVRDRRSPSGNGVARGSIITRKRSGPPCADRPSEPSTHGADFQSRCGGAITRGRRGNLTRLLASHDAR
jgi:hypothetical protein